VSWLDYEHYPHPPDTHPPAPPPRTGDTDSNVGNTGTPTAKVKINNPNRSQPEHDHSATGGSRSDLTVYHVLAMTLFAAAGMKR
jgi:hypothetical protein